MLELKNYLFTERFPNVQTFSTFVLKNFPFIYLHNRQFVKCAVVMKLKPFVGNNMHIDVA